MKSWDNTRKSFVNWLSKSDLRKEFSEKIKFEGLSFWWLTSLLNKDNINQVHWYENLNQKLNFQNKKNFHEKLNYFLLIFKLIKSLILKILSNLIIRFLFFETIKKKDFNKKMNCFFALYTNCVDYKGSFIDRQYGLASYKETENKYYIIEIPENFFLIKNFFKIKKNLKNIPLKFIISNKNLKLTDIIRVYFSTTVSFFRMMKILKKNNYFIINAINCSDILEKKLIESFFGSIQDQLLRGKALHNSLIKKSTKNFINCFDFHPQARSFYHYAKKANIDNVININHANYSENNIFFNFNKEDFSKVYSSYYSPQPDIFFTQGEKYYKKLKEVFDEKKIFCLGSLKPELNKFPIPKKSKNLSPKQSKKIITFLCSINDYKSFIKILNECNQSDFEIYVMPHPLKKFETIKYFKKELRSDFIDATNLDKKKIFGISDNIIFGDTSLGLELSLLNYNVLRLYCSDFIPTFDINDEIPTATNKDEFLNLLNKDHVMQKAEEIEKNYFYKYDMKASERLEEILSKLT